MTPRVRACAAWILVTSLGAALCGCNQDNNGAANTETATLPAAGTTDGTAAGGTNTSGANASGANASGTNTGVTSGAASVSISWDPPTTNMDGSALTNLAGYHIHYGVNSAALSQEIDIPTVGLTDYVIQGLGAGTYFFAISSYNTDGTESSNSPVVSASVG